MNSDKIYNKKSKRFITINGAQYNKLIKKGYTINKKGQLSLPDIKSSSSITINEVLNNPSFLLSFEPKDLLSLSLTNKDIANKLNNINTITLLNKKYNQHIDTTDFLHG